jgi:dCMP deaminase
MSKVTPDTLFMNVAEMFAQQSSCASRKVGAVIVKDNRIISQGYNGDVEGGFNCPGKDLCLTKDKRCGGDTIHAEENAILFAAREGISTKGCVVYVTTIPCRFCMKRLFQAGIRKVIYRDDYRDMDGMKIAIECKMVIQKIES